jgi:hypothetical protein
VLMESWRSTVQNLAKSSRLLLTNIFLLRQLNARE